MASLSELAKEKAKLLESIPEELATKAEKVQLRLWRQLSPLVNSLETDSSGNIIQSESNIRAIGEIGVALNRLLAGDEYREVVKYFLDSIDRNVEITNEIAREFEKGFEPTNAQKQLLNISKQNAIDSFIGTGLRSRVIQPFIEQLTANISARAPLAQAVRALEGVIVGEGKTDGRLLANIKTTSTTAQAVADRSYSASVNEEIGIEFFRYVGGEIPTTRPFCEHREGQIFHRKEIEAWGNGKNSAGINDIEDGTWQGQIKGTDSKSIFTFLGGWNCRHALVPVNKRQVPPDVIARAKAEGYID